jgi:hypothetical protein
MSIIFTYNLTLNEKLLKMGVPGVAMASVCTILCMCMFFTYLYLTAGIWNWKLLMAIVLAFMILGILV